MAAEDFFATCAPGLEPVLHAELTRGRFGGIERQVGGVAFRGQRVDLWRANLQLRTAGRVLMRLARFAAADDDALYRGARAVAWERWVAPDGSVAVRSHVANSALTHSQFVAQRVKDAVCDRLRELLGQRPSVDRDAPDFAIHVHLSRDRCTLSADTTGDALYRRGWRRSQGRAPLSETLAAGIVLASGWDRRSPLVDPFCGSGTVLVEAALLASDTAPGLFRERFAFEGWLDHDAAAWARVRATQAARSERPSKVVLRGVDRAPEAIEGARQNLAAAGLDDWVELALGDALDVEWKRGWNAYIVTNPPYGERIGRVADLERLYRAFGARLAERCAGYHLALLTARKELVAALDQGLRERPADAARDAGQDLELANGPLDCILALRPL